MSEINDTEAPLVSEDVEVVTEDSEPQRVVNEPGKLMRIGLMLREMQEEVRRADPDEAGRDRLRIVHSRAVQELCQTLSPELQEELSQLTLPFTEEEPPTGSEIRIAQAQLIGWLEGLFQGIQAAIFSQQMEARQQLEQMRQRGLPPGMRPPDGRPGPSEPGQRGMGQYL
ncbi:MAG TPA: proteasome activator [Egibacteraceae bacterium]|jgi:flagellar biosynthesis/type III secretory pathway protein FliH|nr:proteasome activator [Egibacteraceae bacterium]